MANKAMPTEDDNWRGESDHGSLMRACEIIADKSRMAGVRRHMIKQEGAKKTLNKMLAMHKRTGRLY